VLFVQVHVVSFCSPIVCNWLYVTLGGWSIHVAVYDRVNVGVCASVHLHLHVDNCTLILVYTQDNLLQERAGQSV
jgi:hypothetical protein